VLGLPVGVVLIVEGVGGTVALQFLHGFFKPNIGEGVPVTVREFQ